MAIDLQGNSFSSLTYRKSMAYWTLESSIANVHNVKAKSVVRGDDENPAMKLALVRLAAPVAVGRDPLIGCRLR